MTPAYYAAETTNNGAMSRVSDADEYSAPPPHIDPKNK